VWQKITTPLFEDYRAIVWHGKVVSIDPSSHPVARIIE
jgi:hypothetical protein